MQTILPCPICQHTLTLVATPRALACPFCRTAIHFHKDKIPVGEKVRCSSCQGVFTAEAPPPLFRVFAAAPESCPFCQALLAIRKEIPPGSVVRCPSCQKKFHTKGTGEIVWTEPPPLPAPDHHHPQPTP